MSALSITVDYQRRPSSKITAHSRQEFNRGAYFRRMEQFDARRNGARTGAVTAPPQHLDARLLEDGEALEIAWGYEITTLIAKKRLKTPEADAVANEARAAAALVVARIEAAKALTLDGLKVKARAILWTRNGEPLGAGFPGDRNDEDA
jgi:hypothetical protein